MQSTSMLRYGIAGQWGTSAFDALFVDSLETILSEWASAQLYVACCFVASSFSKTANYLECRSSKNFLRVKWTPAFCDRLICQLHSQSRCKGAAAMALRSLARIRGSWFVPYIHRSKEPLRQHVCWVICFLLWSWLCVGLLRATFLRESWAKLRVPESSPKFAVCLTVFVLFYFPRKVNTSQV